MEKVGKPSEISAHSQSGTDPGESLCINKHEFLETTSRGTDEKGLVFHGLS